MGEAVIERIELTEMPTKEMLEDFVTQMVMGQTVTVYFDTEQGKFVRHGEV